MEAKKVDNAFVVADGAFIGPDKFFIVFSLLEASSGSVRIANTGNALTAIRYEPDSKVWRVGSSKFTIDLVDNINIDKEKCVIYLK